MGKCTHDWRVNPFVSLLSDPPRRQLVCALCHDVKLESVQIRQMPSKDDVRTWPRA